MPILKVNLKKRPYKTEQTLGCQGGGKVGEGWSGSLGLLDENYHI